MRTVIIVYKMFHVCLNITHNTLACICVTRIYPTYVHCVFVRKLTIEVWYMVILVEAMKSPSDEELDYSSDSSECYQFFSYPCFELLYSGKFSRVAIFADVGFSTFLHFIFR